MNEPENMSLKEESQENDLSINPDFDLAFHERPDSPDGKNREVEPQEADEESLVHFIAEGHSEEHDKQKKKEHKEAPNNQFEIFSKDFQSENNIEHKLQMAIDFMENSLAQGGSPHFRNFWEARRLCLSLFKENISPQFRNQLWNKYSELSKEARRLKEILDEQSAFAVEQIEIAVKALEIDIDQFDEQVQKAVLSSHMIFPQALNDKYQIYEDLQKQLNLLNAQAARINALRKELLKTEMRVRQKNKFFQRLSAAGDKVFPRRKELIRQISHQFTEDVNVFIETHFKEEQLNHESLYLLREEIKFFQGLAKVLTLNTNAFTQTRMHLSECWDKIKSEEKGRKKERAHQRSIYRQNAEEIQQRIQAFKEDIEQRQHSLAESQRTLDDIVAFMRKVELGRDELKVLREHLNEIRQLLQNRLKEEEEARLQQEIERSRQKKERYNSLREQIGTLLNQYENYDVDKLQAERDALMAQVSSDSSLTKGEKQELERLLKPLRDAVTEKREKMLMSLSEDDRQALQQLKNILMQRKERRLIIKNQLEIYRKEVGSSSLDFEKAMAYTAQINEEKERLEKANQGIKEIEVKITELQSKIKS